MVCTEMNWEKVMDHKMIKTNWSVVTDVIEHEHQIEAHLWTIISGRLTFLMGKETAISISLVCPYNPKHKNKSNR